MGQRTLPSRLAGASALLVAVAYVAAVPLALSDAPDAAAAPTVIAAWLTDHRSGLLVALVLNGFAWCALMPLVLVTVRDVLGPAGRAMATVGLVGAVLEGALIGVALILEGAAALGAPRLPVPEIAALHDGYVFAISASAWPTVMCAAAFAVAIARTAVLPRWTAGLAAAVAVAHSLAGVSVSDHGVLSATGAFADLAPALMTVWLATIGVVLLRLPVPVVPRSTAPAVP